MIWLTVTAPKLEFNSAPYRLSGVVYGCLLNHAPALASLGDAVHAAPYKAPPRAPVLYLKPRNTLAAEGQAVRVPAGSDAGPGAGQALQVGAALGLVIGQTACKLTEADALACLAGVTIVNDLSMPHDSFYRPNVRLRARDGFCPISTRVVPLADLAAPVDALGVRVFIDGVLVHSTTTGERLRNAARLLADVSEFMTLSPGDVLMLGVSAGAPLAYAGQLLRIEIDGLGSLNTPLVADGAAVRTALSLRPGPQQTPPQTGPETDLTADPQPDPKTNPLARPSLGPSPGPSPGPLSSQRSARVAYGGALHTATPHAPDASGTARLRLADGRILGEHQVVWLPPFEVGTVIALGLNYADHVKELSKELTLSAQDEPLVFLKGPGALIGHRGHTRRPAGATYMHYECELAVVIGRTAHQVLAADAMAHVAGYTVCNDYAVRDYLENWYRPNLRVKNRDGGTVLGPWFVPAAEVPDPHALALRTRVNGRVTQQGHTGQMIHRIPALIEYLSAFMTLQAGDVILTGTPDGVVNVALGDEVVCEIDGIGSLYSTLAADAEFGR